MHAGTCHVVVIDEVQRIPQLNEVHRLIEKVHPFSETGSSARKRHSQPIFAKNENRIISLCCENSEF